MAEQARLKTGALGAAGITFLVVAAAAPLTVMTGVAPLAVSIGGIGAPVGYLLAGVVLTIFAVGFMAMTRHTRGAGAFYSYITLGLGRPLGAAAGLLAVLSYNALQIGVYGLLGVQFAGAWTRFTGSAAPWWIFSGLGIAGVWALGRRGIDVGAKVIGTLLIAETAILVLLVAGILTDGVLNDGGLSTGGLSAGSFTPDAVTNPGMLAILGFCFAAFMGFESTALYRSEARRPDRSIPRATYASVAFLGLFYCLVVWAIVQAFGDDRVVEAAGADPTGLFFSAMDTFVGAWASDVMYVLVLTSVLASQLAFHNAINRYAYTLAHDGLLPAVFGRTHPRFLSPATAGAAQTIVVVVVVAAFALAGADPYLQLLLLVNTPGAIGVVTLQALTSAAVLAYFLRRRGVPGARVAIAAGGLALALLTGVLYLLIDNVALLTGAAFGVNAFLVALVPAILAAGAGWALRIKIKSPSSYGRIGGEAVRAMNPVPSAPVVENENRRTEESHA